MIGVSISVGMGFTGLHLRRHEPLIATTVIGLGVR